LTHNKFCCFVFCVEIEFFWFFLQLNLCD
jgi:hypothetical protein